MTQETREELLAAMLKAYNFTPCTYDNPTYATAFEKPMRAALDAVIANLPLVAKAAGAEVRTETREVCPLGDDPHPGPCAFVTEQSTVIETQWRKVEQ